MTYGYNPRSLKKSSDAKKIIAKFSLAASEEREVKLLNVYKGVPISYSASIIRVINDRLTLKVHKNQALCLNLEGQTYIVSNIFSNPVKAKVMSVNTVEQIAILTDLSIASVTIGKRGTVRVSFDREDQGNVVIIARDTEVRLLGKLNNISVNGIGVDVIAIQRVILENFSESSNVYIHMSLPLASTSDYQDITLPGIIRYIGSDQEKYKLGIQIAPNDQTKEQINLYINQRQSEIMEEVEKYSTTYNTGLDVGDWWYPS